MKKSNWFNLLLFGIALLIVGKNILNLAAIFLGINEKFGIGGLIISFLSLLCTFLFGYIGAKRYVTVFSEGGRREIIAYNLGAVLCAAIFLLIVAVSYPQISLALKQIQP